MTSIIKKLKNSILKKTNESTFLSQEGEDILLARIFDKKNNSGYYIDIGAHDPFRFSSTHYFYRLGWRGINIDPLPSAKEKFHKHRPEDTFILAGVSQEDNELAYYQFEEPAFNTFNLALAESRKVKSPLKSITQVKCYPLSRIFEENNVGEIDFLSIDVEGFELSVLHSNNWSKYTPKVIVIEILDFDFDKFKDGLIYQFLTEKGYTIFSKLFHSVIFIHNKHTHLVRR